MKENKKPNPKLTAIFVREISTKTIISVFPPTRAGEKRANRYKGLADLEIVKQYS